MAVYYENPAGRLYGILEKLKKVAPSQEVKAAWRDVLLIASGDDIELARRMLLVFQLPSEIYAQLTALNDQDFDLDLAMRWHDPVQSALSGTLLMSGQIQHVASKYGDRELTSLEACSFVLHRYCAEPKPKEGELSSIRELIAILEDELRRGIDPRLDEELRDFLGLHAHMMGRAIDEFFIAGSAGLRAQYERAVGAVALNHDIFIRIEEESKKDPDSAGGKFWKILSRVAIVLSMSSNIFTLSATVHEELANHSDGSVVHGIAHSAVRDTNESPAAASVSGDGVAGRVG